jgi:hypothetical protein
MTLEAMRVGRAGLYDPAVRVGMAGLYDPAVRVGRASGPARVPQYHGITVCWQAKRISCLHISVDMMMFDQASDVPSTYLGSLIQRVAQVRCVVCRSELYA